jgi:hypothetical protein
LQTGTDPISAISAQGSEGAPNMERENSNQPAVDLEALAAEKGRPLEVDDLDEAGWKAASGKGMIEELGSLGEGAGGAVTKSRLKGGKTTFALKVRVGYAMHLLSLTFPDHHHRSQPRRKETDCARTIIQQELRKRPYLPILRSLCRRQHRNHQHRHGVL